MKKFPIWALLATLLLGPMLAACDMTNEADDTETSRDCIISAVTIGTLKRTIHTTTKAGEDSTYTVSVTGSLYPVYIDQVNYRIYNADSLPVGTDVSKTVFSTFNYSSGITVKSLSTGADTSFVYTDSTDFSVPRTLTAHAADGTSRRDYTVELRVHREEADTFAWNRVADNPLGPVASFVESRALCVEGRLYVFGRLADGDVQLVQTPTTAPAFDQAVNVTTLSGATLDVRSVHYFKDAFYALAGGRLVRAAEPSDTWTDAAAPQTFDALAATDGDSLYALGGGRMYASANGTDWTESAIDTEGALPQTNLAAASQTSTADAAYKLIVLVGDDAAGRPCVWRRDIDTRGDYSYPWMLLPQTEELGDYALPQLGGVSLTPYDGKTLLAGTLSDGTLAPLYVSSDNGRTWRTGDIDLPVSGAATAVTTAVDSDHCLWVVVSGQGTVWRGRLNRLGWTDEQTRFDRAARR